MRIYLVKPYSWICFIMTLNKNMMNENLMESIWKACGVLYVDHVAVTTKDLNQTVKDYLGLPNAKLLRGPSNNTKQNVDYAFIQVEHGLVIEVLGLLPDSPIEEHVSRGGGTYHLCFAVEDLDKASIIAKKHGASQVLDARKDDAFDGRRVAFFVHGRHGLFEFVEAFPSAINDIDTSEHESVSIHPNKNNSGISTSDKGHDRVYKIFSTVFPLEKPENFIGSSIGNIKGWDSLGHILLMMEIEKEFELRFDVNEMSELDSFDKIKNKLLEK